MSGISAKLRYLCRGAFDLFYPRQSLISGDALGAGSAYRYLTEKEAEGIAWVKHAACRSCGKVFEGVLAGERDCPNCVELKPVFEEGRTAFMLEEVGRKIIHELKYHQGFHVWRDIRRLLREEVPKYLGYIEGAILVPVPLHRSKLRQRGFNQSLLLAENLAKEGQVLGVEDILRRVRKTQTQTHLSKVERRRNVRGAFEVCKKASILPEKLYIIVDDVFTTGATLNACAQVLKKSGANRVKVITLGHG